MNILKKKSWTCYAIASGNKTYIGKTNDMKRRLRQHNGELKGGAKYTRTSKTPWKVLFRVDGFDTNQNVLRFEWRMHHPPHPIKNSFKKKKRRYYKQYRGIEGRIRALSSVISLDKWTTKSPRSSKFPLKIRYVSNNKLVKNFIKEHIEKNIPSYITLKTEENSSKLLEN